MADHINAKNCIDPHNKQAVTGTDLEAPRTKHALDVKDHEATDRLDAIIAALSPPLSANTTIQGKNSGNYAEVDDKNNLKILVDFAQPIADRYSYLTFSIGDGINFIQNDTIITTPPMTFSGQILGYSIAETSIDPPNASLEVEVYKDNLTNYPPNDLVSSTFPIKLQNEKIKIQDSVGGNWDRSFTKGDCFRFIVKNSDNTAKKIQCTISLLRAVNIDAYPKTSPVTISFNLGDGVNPIQSDLSTFSAPLPFSGKVISYSLANVDTLPQPVNIELAMLKDNLTNYPPTTEISGVNGIKLENETVKLEEDLSDWSNVNINYNDIIGFKVKASDNIIKKAILFIYIEKNQ